MDVSIALSVVPVIVGLVVRVLRLGLSPVHEAPTAVLLGILISLGYALASQVPGGNIVADALFRGVAMGITSAGLIATIRRFALEGRTGKRRRHRAPAQSAAAVLRSGISLGHPTGA